MDSAPTRRWCSGCKKTRPIADFPLKGGAREDDPNAERALTCQPCKRDVGDAYNSAHLDRRLPVEPYQKKLYQSQSYQSQSYQSQSYQSQSYQSQPREGRPKEGKHKRKRDVGDAYNSAHQDRRLPVEPYQKKPYQSQPYQSQPREGRPREGRPREGKHKRLIEESVRRARRRVGSPTSHCKGVLETTIRMQRGLAHVSRARYTSNLNAGWADFTDALLGSATSATSTTARIETGDSQWSRVR
ncbi:hypothetical protein E4U26_008532 [Claviceps purpurea]|nr:hypothetical protein E4U26_008532 [Claviceps purpurea]